MGFMESIFGNNNKKEGSDGGDFMAIPEDQKLDTTEEEAKILERMRLEKENGQKDLTDQG